MRVKFRLASRAPQGDFNSRQPHAEQPNTQVLGQKMAEWEFMGLQENKNLILEHYDAFVHRQDAEAVRKQLAEDFLDHDMPPGIPPGPEGALQYRAVLHRAFPDLHVRLDDVVAEGDRVAVRATWTGTHRGPFPMLSFPPTNSAFEFTGMVFWRIRDGRIAERWAILDRLRLQQQLTAKK